MKVICLIILLATLFGKWNAPPGIKGYIENRTDWKVEVIISDTMGEQVKKLMIPPIFFNTKTVYLLPGKYRIKLIAYKKGEPFKACEYALIPRESDYLIDRDEKGWEFIIADIIFKIPGHKIELKSNTRAMKNRI